MADADPHPSLRHAATPHRMPLPDCVALVLQGGGALGAYQAGVCEGLAATAIEIDWVAGVSIGAVNAAIIAGNAPEHRVEKLSGFWEELTSSLPGLPMMGGDNMREAMHLASAAWVAAFGVPAFFAPRPLSPVFAAPETPAAQSFYDPSPMYETLARYVDWDRVNDGPTRLSVGAVDVASGNLHYFDTADTRLDARHVMASGALPPGLPPVEIEGRHYWDGGIVSNTPLSHVLERQGEDMLIFQVDLFPARGEVPHTIVDVYSREKEIRYSSRTRAVTDQLLRLRREREAMCRLLRKLPAEMCDDPEVRTAIDSVRENAVNVVHLIYRKREWEHGTRDFEFSRPSMLHHWEEGRRAVMETMQQDQLLAKNILNGETAAFDLAG